MLFLSERKKLLCEDTCGEVLVVLLITINNGLVAGIDRTRRCLLEGVRVEESTEAPHHVRPGDGTLSEPLSRVLNQRQVIS